MNYDVFLRNYLIPNKPCLFRSESVGTRIWKSSAEWVTEDGTPNFSFLVSHFGNSIVPVADCNIKHYNAQMKQEMTLNEYVDYWKELISAGHDYPHFPCFYMKDWHFRREFPNYVAYTTPIFFMSDWLNEFFDERADESDDYRFVYMGPKGSWTPLHMDVFGSHSWSVNVCGRKRWLLFPPGAEEYLRDKHNQLIYDVTDGTLLGSGDYPDIEKLFNTWGSGIEVIQGPGEAIFVPSGWHHQVWNLEDTISVNHNWFNGSNINFIWKNLMQALKDVEAELNDCKDMTDWPQTCQLVLKAHHGMNVEEFCQLLFCIAARADREAPVCATQINWQSALDIVSISEVLKSMCQEEVAENLGLKEKISQLISKLEDIKKTIIFDGTKA